MGGTFSATTYNTGDQITGGAGTDAINLTIDGALKLNSATAINAPSVSGVETLNLRAVATMSGTSSVTVDASQLVGLTAFNSDRSTDAVAITNVAATTSVGVIGNGTVVTGALSATYVAGVTAATLNVAGGTATGSGAVTIVGNADALLKTLTVNSTGAANTLGGIVTPAAVTAVNINAATNLVTGGITGVAVGTTITVSGAATTVDLGTLAANATTVNAAGLTVGGIKATLSAVTDKVTGGAGNDTITTGGIVLTTGSVDAGAGTGDKLIVTAAADVAATPAAKYTNFEVLQVSAAAATVDASLITGITSVELNGAAGVTGLNATQAAAITVLATDAAATIALKDATGTADVATIALQNATAAAVATPINLTTATLNGFETLNLAVNSGLNNVLLKSDGVTAAVAGTDFDQVTIAAATSLKAINVTGAYAADVNVNGVAAKVATIDASANTAGVQIEVGGQTQALTVTGTAAADLITLSAAGIGGSYVINTGAGVDKITGAQAVIAASTINGGAGIDTLVITDTANPTINDNTFVNVTGIEKFVVGAATGLNWVVGGYANAAATANGGVLDISGTLGTVVGPVVINASGLGAGNSLKLALTEITGTDAAGDMTITGSAGADNIKITTVATNAGDITINAIAGTAAKTIDLSAVAAVTGAVTVTTGAGADVIKAAVVNGTYTAGAGADALTAGAGVDTFAYGINTSVTGAAGVNMDTITNFTTGTDKIQLLSGATGVGSLLGLTLVGGNTAAVMGAVVTDATSVATVADVYALLAVDLLTTTNAFVGSTAGAGGIVAREVTFTTGAAAGTYLVINDSTASFQAANDIVIKLVGTTTFAAGDITVV